MISSDLRAQIRHWFYAEHWKIGTIAQEFGLHANTVRHALETDQFNRGKVLRPLATDPYVEFLQQTLQNHPRLRATRIYHMIRERGYVEASRSCDAWSPACDRRDGKLSCDSACIPLHFQTWQDKAGNALPRHGQRFPGFHGATVIFMDLKTAKGETNPESLNGDTLQANLIMPEPCHFDDLTVQAQEVEPHQEHVLRPAQGVPEVFDVFANYLLQK